MEVLSPIVPQHWPEAFDLKSRPLLRLALGNGHPAYSVRVEWLVDSLADGVLRRRMLTNYTQILRQPFTRRRREDGTVESFVEASEIAGKKILDEAERTLWYGKPTYGISDYPPLSTCGGVLHYLKRRVYENDTVSLRELQPLVLLRDRGEGDEFKAEEHRTHEWLWEFSLQVNPGHYERGMSPVAAPPSKPESLRAFPQGSRFGDEVSVPV